MVGEYGFYWYHSHFRAYYNDAIRGPLLIRPSPSRRRPFESLARNATERTQLLEAERHGTSILLNDWTHEPSDAIYARYLETGAFPFCVDSILANGHGRVQCLPRHILQAGPGLGLRSSDNSSMHPMSMSMGHMGHKMPKRMGMESMTMSMDHATPTMTMPSSHQTSSGSNSTSTMSGMSLAMTSLTPRGCMPPMMFRDGYDASDLPPETCTNTTSPLLTIPANRTNGWLALNLVNSGAVSPLRVSLDSHSMFVYAADGLYVEPQETKVSTVF